MINPPLELLSTAWAQKSPAHKHASPEQLQCASFTGLDQPGMLREGGGGRLQPIIQLSNTGGNSSQHAELLAVFRVLEEAGPLPSWL